MTSLRRRSSSVLLASRFKHTHVTVEAQFSASASHCASYLGQRIAKAEHGAVAAQPVGGCLHRCSACQRLRFAGTIAAPCDDRERPETRRRVYEAAHRSYLNLPGSLSLYRSSSPAACYRWRPAQRLGGGTRLGKSLFPRMTSAPTCIAPQAGCLVRRVTSTTR